MSIPSFRIYRNPLWALSGSCQDQELVVSVISVTWIMFLKDRPRFKLSWVWTTLVTRCDAMTCRWILLRQVCTHTFLPYPRPWRQHFILPVYHLFAIPSILFSPPYTFHPPGREITRTSAFVAYITETNSSSTRSTGPAMRSPLCPSNKSF